MLSISRSIDYQGGAFLKTTLNSLLFHTGYITIDEEHKGEISFNIRDIEQQVPILAKFQI